MAMSTEIGQILRIFPVKAFCPEIGLLWTYDARRCLRVTDFSTSTPCEVIDRALSVFRPSGFAARVMLLQDFRRWAGDTTIHHAFVRLHGPLK